MPELPEVETVRATLARHIIGEKIIKVDIFVPRIVDNDIHQFDKIIGEKITDVARYGKYLIFILEQHSFISHLRMEGKYFIKNISDPLEKHEHIIFTMESKMSLRYHDTRKFGTMRVVDTIKMDEILKEKEIAKLGKEANDPSFDYLDLFHLLSCRKEPLKTALLDQSIICGLGNIYVDEVCFASGLSPELKCNYITKDDCRLILSSAKLILNEAIRCGGTTIRSYTSSLGVTGRFQLNLKVHTKDGCQCPNCSATILKTTVGGRGTYYCPCCQVKTRPFLIGITGGIGSGKSKVSNYLLSKGYDVIDTDKISHALSSSNEVIQQIEIAFGKEYLENGTLNRKKLGSLVFKDVDANKKLTSILHPLIKTEVKKEINVAARLLKPLVFIDVPLLYESGFDELVNKVICVSTTEEINIARLMKRDNIDEIYAKEKIASQMKMETKKQLADFNVDNSFDLCYTYKQIDQILNDKLKVKGKQDEI